MGWAALVLAVVLFAGPAFGQGEIGKTYSLKGNDGQPIAIWHSESAADSGGALLRAGQTDLAARYMSCVVTPGTRVLVMPMPYAHWTDNTRKVTVLDGKSRGCESSVYSWDIYGNLKEREAGWKKIREENKADQERSAREAKQNEARMAERRVCFDKSETSSADMLDCLRRTSPIP
jgi:hypothetical protein